MRFFYCFPSLSCIYVAGSQCHLWPFISPPFSTRSSPNWSSSYILYFSLPPCHHCHPRSGSLCLLLGLLYLNGASYWVLVFSLIHSFMIFGKQTCLCYLPTKRTGWVVTLWDKIQTPWPDSRLYCFTWLPSFIHIYFLRTT